MMESDRMAAESQLYSKSAPKAAKNTTCLGLALSSSLSKPTILLVANN